MATIVIGSSLGPFRIVDKLGEGGMGEVYRARDTKLNRDVALKILPEAFTADGDRVARFRREAQVLASLNHPNIAAIYGFEDSGDTQALVLELVEGPTLADRIAKGPIPLEEALPIAKQIAEALEVAHKQGIIHRDLKPANIKVRGDRTVKVLDFGLAKVLESPTGVADASRSPTRADPPTRAGVLLGTAAYMSPEQARGEAVDHQADIWAFGCVLFEMLSGRRAFDGRTVSDVIAAVLREEPEWTRLPRDLDPRIRVMLERCLVKEATNRYHSIADVRVDIQSAAAGRSAGTMDSSTLRPAARRTLLWAAVAAAVAGGVAGAGVWVLKPANTPRLARFAHVLPPDESFSRIGSGIVAISPDGSSMVYAANGSLFLKSIDRVDAQPITGTKGDPTNPFFSSDGRSVGYHDFKDGELRRIEVSGGRPVTLARVTNLFGATWSSDDTIVFGQEDGVWRIPASGGTPERLVTIKPGERVHAPQLLRGGKSLLFTLRTDIGPRGWDDARLVVQSLENGERRIIATGRDGRYLPTGHLVYGLKSALFAVPFDVDGLRIRGAPVPLVEGVREPTFFPGTTGSANYDVSATGTLVYVAGEASAPIERELVVVDRRGNVKPIVSEKRNYWRPRLSPNGSHIVVEVAEQGFQQLWIVDLKDGAASALTSGARGNDFATWSPDGESVIYRSSRQEGYGIYRQAVDGRGGPQLIHPSADEAMPGDVSRDGVLVFAVGEQTGRRAIFTLPMVGGPPSAFLDTPALEHMPTFAPDGHWIAYASNESGRSEVYIRPYPPRDQIVRRVSQNGGTAPVWSRDGSELFYRSEAGNLVAVPVSLGAGISVGRAEQLFQMEGRFRISGNAPAYDVDASGRFIMVTESNQPRFARQINIVQNWTGELKRLVPTK